jgi:4-dimethylallyltryptophan N-methyltransferase
MPKMSSPRCHIIDIRQAKFEESIPGQVEAGLRQQLKTLPALLFYSTEGIRHWNRHSQAEDFYPRHEEIQILRNHAVNMAASIADNSVIVDLGSAFVFYSILIVSSLFLTASLEALTRLCFYWMHLRRLGNQ